MKEQTVGEMISTIVKSYGETNIKIRYNPSADIWKITVKLNIWNDIRYHKSRIIGEGKTIQLAVTSAYRQFCKDAAERAKLLEEDLKAAKTLAGRLKGEG